MWQEVVDEIPHGVDVAGVVAADVHCVGEQHRHRVQLPDDEGGAAEDGDQRRRGRKQRRAVSSAGRSPRRAGQRVRRTLVFRAGIAVCCRLGIDPGVADCLHAGILLAPPWHPQSACGRIHRRFWPLRPAIEGESMTASALEQQLTGPGGPFEVVVEDVMGVPTKVYRQRLRSLREVAALAEQRASLPFLAYRNDQVSYGEFAAMSRAVSAELAAGPARLGPGDRVAVLAANCPEWCTTFWGTVAMGS